MSPGLKSVENDKPPSTDNLLIGALNNFGQPSLLNVIVQRKMFGDFKIERFFYVFYKVYFWFWKYDRN